MPFEVNKRGPGRPRKESDTVPEESHVVMDDGSYRNTQEEPRKSFDRSAFPVGRFISLSGPYPVGGWVYHISDDGMRIRVTRDREPDINECPYRTWEYIEKHLQESL